jgi:DNA-directed RNA polymerase subunit L
MSDETTNNLAVKIARLLQTETREDDLYSLQQSIEKISERLEKIETSINNQSYSILHPLSFILQNRIRARRNLILPKLSPMAQLEIRNRKNLARMNRRESLATIVRCVARADFRTLKSFV